MGTPWPFNINAAMSAVDHAAAHRARTEVELREKLTRISGHLSESQAAFIAKSLVRDYVIVARG